MLGSRLLMMMLCGVICCDMFVIKLVSLVWVVFDSLRMVIGVLIDCEVMLIIWF